jgi:hypothetical protein
MKRRKQKPRERQRISWRGIAHMRKEKELEDKSTKVEAKAEAEAKKGAGK